MVYALVAPSTGPERGGVHGRELRRLILAAGPASLSEPPTSLPPVTDDAAYLRFPTVHGDSVAFVAEDDVWLAALSGGRAWRLTADAAPVAGTRFSPDGSLLAHASRRDGAPEVHVVGVDGGPARRLTHWGEETTRVVGWRGDRVLAVTAAGQPFRSRLWAHAVPLDGGPPERLPHGPVTAVATGPGGVTVLGVNQSRRSAAAWKRYRGGTAGVLWIDRDGSGQFTRLLGDVAGQLEDPAWVGDRIVFLSDHEGWGNVYSVRPDGTNPRRHTDHGDAYARAASTDGRRVVYQCLGELWLLDGLDADSRPRRLDIRLAGPRTARTPRPIDAADEVGDVSPDATGRASAVEVRGTVHWLTHRDGPARALADQPGVRARLPRVLGATAPPPSARADSDAEPSTGAGPADTEPPGAEASSSGSPPAGMAEAGTTPDAGPADTEPPGAEASTSGSPPAAMAEAGTTPDAGPAGEGAAALAATAGATTDGAGPADTRAHADVPPPRVAWVTDAEGDDAIEVVSTAGVDTPRRLAAGQLGRVLELAAAPNGRTLAVASHDGRVLIVEVDSGAVRTARTSEHGDASGLSFSPDSRWLAWSHPGPTPLRQILLARVDDPDADVVVATSLRFADTNPVFTLDGRHLAFLSARTFDPVYDAHVFDMSFPAAIRPFLLPLAATTPSPFDPEPEGRPAPRPDGGSDGDDDRGAPRVVIDAEGLEQRAVPVPVPAARAGALQAVRDGLLWLESPLVGVLGEGSPDDRRPRLRRYDLRKRKAVTLADAVDGIAVTGDGRWVVVRDGSSLRLVPADRRADPSSDDDESTVDIDLGRVRVRLDPAAEWRQMYEETGRLMRDHFWIADFAGVDWAGVLDRYRPVLDRIGSRDDLSELIWEVQGELGSSHAYEIPPDRPVDAVRRVGHLGADLARDPEGRWRVERIVPGETSAPAARSPLVAPGVAMRPGDVVEEVDGRPVDPVAGPAALLVGAAGHPVELTVSRDGRRRRVVVEPLGAERALRYHAWVADRRAATHAASAGRVGYLHVPDMTGEGWAQLHRDLHLEVARDALVVDLRDNGGGHTSELVLEKLARIVHGWDTVRHSVAQPYPSNAPRGPLVAVTNEHAGSDGDIGTAMFRKLGLGPVVGTRTWGGVIGIDSRYRLVDGTTVTQPRYSFWFTDLGWGVENHGVDPDVEVPFPPQAWAAGADPQLEAAIRLALEALRERSPATPPDPATRPSRLPPTLPPRGTATPS